MASSSHSVVMPAFDTKKKDSDESAAKHVPENLLGIESRVKCRKFDKMLSSDDKPPQQPEEQKELLQPKEEMKNLAQSHEQLEIAKGAMA